MVLMPLFGSDTSYAVSEGVPTWLGGTLENGYAGAVRELDVALRADPSLTLDSLLDAASPNRLFYPAAAVIADLSYDRGGTDHLKRLFSAGSTPADLRAFLSASFGVDWKAFTELWRARVRQVAATAPPQPSSHSPAVRARSTGTPRVRGLPCE